MPKAASRLSRSGSLSDTLSKPSIRNLLSRLPISAGRDILDLRWIPQDRLCWIPSQNGASWLDSNSDPKVFRKQRRCLIGKTASNNIIHSHCVRATGDEAVPGSPGETPYDHPFIYVSSCSSFFISLNASPQNYGLRHGRERVNDVEGWESVLELYSESVQSCKIEQCQIRNE